MQDTTPYPSFRLDANDVNFRVQHLRVFELIEKIEEGKLDILEGDRFLQRYLDKWDTCQKSSFIESLMLDFPLPVFYFDGSLSRWKVIDGIKRILAIYQFIAETYQLTGLDYFVEEAENTSYKNLPAYLRNRIRNAEVVVYIINPGTPLRVRYNIFKRINTTGVEKSSKPFYSRSGMKTRNVFFRGKINGWIRKASRNGDFRRATKPVGPVAVGSKAIARREYVSLFIAFQIEGSNGGQERIEDFIASGLLSFYESFEEKKESLLLLFAESMQRMQMLFGEDHYTLFPTKQEDVLVFNGWARLLAEMDSVKFERLRKQKEFFLHRYKETAFYRDPASGSECSLGELFEKLCEFVNPYIQ